MTAFLRINHRIRAGLRRPIVAAALGAIAAIALPELYRAASAWSSLRDALVVVDGETIERADLERELKRRGLAAQSLSRLGRSVLDDMVELEMLAAAARRSGYADDADVRYDVKHALAGRYRSETIEAPLSEIAVGNDEIAAYYDANLEQFTLPEAAHAAIVFLAAPAAGSQERREAAEAKAEELRREVEARIAPAESHFGPLAVRHSDDQASRYRGGDVGWLEKGQADSRFEPAVLDAMFALEQPGQMAPVIATEAGFYVVKLLDKKPERTKPLAAVADEMRARLLRSKRAERERELRDRAVAGVEVRMNESQIAALGFAADEPPTLNPKAPNPLVAMR